ncbi:putative protein CXorf57-like isoform X2 [Labeo rohita]|uniref:Uncharacterized protein n=1 Tax=Labeo rohita TaxID=84645 RepID=A0A498MSL2_LABRO|nr:putative protein CXorf57-like isoform X2 [Labeo rohita]
MAALSASSSECCTLKKTLNRLISNTSDSPRARTRSEPLYVISLERYGRDADFGLRFPDSISMSDSLFDATITDGDCKIRVSLDPAVNRLISVNKLHCGSVIRHVEFSRGEASDGDGGSFHVCSLEVDRLSGGDAALRALSSVNVRSIPWMGAEPSSGPLRARRSSYLPLWNNHDFNGEVWRDTPPSEPDAEDSEDEIDEISLNSRNPTAQITIIPKNQISPDWVLPDLPHSFICGQELPSCPQGHICDVIGVVIFVGRPERVRRKDGQRSEVEEYRWLQLADRTSDKPIMIKLFSTSQPDIQSRIYPSTGSHPVMPYRGIRPIRQFLHWLKQVDESSLLERAVIGGYFSYPPLPVSLHNFMENRQGEAGLISGGEMKLECEKLNYREKRQFALQCVITAACYHHRERVIAVSLFPADFSLFDGAMEFLVGEQEDDSNDEDDDEEFSTLPTSPMTSRLGLTRVAIETLPRVFCYERRHIQAVAVGLQVNNFHKLLPQRELESFSPASCYTGYFTLSVKADLIATANQLTNQRLLCVLDACALGEEKMELVLNRAFPLR